LTARLRGDRKLSRYLHEQEPVFRIL